MRADRLAWLFGLAAVWLSGCDKPCDTTAQCGEDGMCVAALCQPLVCEKTLFAIDPKSGECMPLSGCFLTTEQRDWQTCSTDPCQGLDENSCVSDARCQPAYANPKVEPVKGSPLGNATPPTVGCAGGSGGHRHLPSAGAGHSGQEPAWPLERYAANPPLDLPNRPRP